jgi:hypothetical protein
MPLVSGVHKIVAEGLPDQLRNNCPSPRIQCYFATKHINALVMRLLTTVTVYRYQITWFFA